MWTGVMVMTPTITTCPMAIAETPSRAAGREVRVGKPRGCRSGEAARAAAEAPNSSRPQGRGPAGATEEQQRASPNRIDEKTKGPASVGTPYARQRLAAGGARRAR